MSNYIPHPNADGLVKLTGTITKLYTMRRHASFVLTKSDKSKMGFVSIATALAGAGGAAMANASNAKNMDEPSDYVQFEFNGERVQGWMWRSRFKDGDEVIIAAVREGHHWEAYGIARPKDRIISLYPTAVPDKFSIIEQPHLRRH